MSVRRYPAGFYPGSHWIADPSSIVGAGGIATSEAFGVPTVTSTAAITGAGGIATSEAFGTPVVSAAVTLTGAGGIASSEAFGVPLVSMAEAITGAGGIATSEAVGHPTISGSAPSTVIVGARYPAGFYPGGGRLVIGAGEIHAAGGIASSEAFGVPLVSIAIAITAAGGIASSEAFGAPTVVPQFAGVIFGRHYPGGFYPAEAPFRLVSGEINAAGGIPSSEAFGVPTITAPVTLTAAGGIATSERFGVPRIGGQLELITLRRYPGGFYPASHPLATLTSLVTGAGGIASSEAFGVPAVLFSIPLTGAGGIPSSEAFGAPTVLLALPLAYSPLYRRRAVGLGCGIYEVAILARGGGQRLLTLPATSLSWSTALDDIAQAQIQCAGPSAKCLSDLYGVWPWQHELSILRSGVEVFVGPIISLEADEDMATIDARDLMFWLTMRDVHNDYTWTGADLATVFNTIVADAMGNPEDTAGLVAAATPCGVTTTRQLLAADQPNAWGEIQSLSSAGIDWTMQRRTLLAGGQAVPTTPFAYLVDSDFATPPKTRRDGTMAANRWIIDAAGSGVASSTTRGEYGPTDPSHAGLVARFGGLEQHVSDARAFDQATAQAAAQSRYAIASTPPTLLTDGVLSPNATVKAEDLVAGRLFDIRLTETAFPLHTQLRLSGIQARADADGEQITTSFQPVGAG